MKIGVERINPYLEVSNLSDSLKYYVDVLGFTLYVETPVLGIIERDRHQIHLFRSEGEVSPHRVWVGVNDIEPLFNQFVLRGAEIYQAPINYSWAYQMMVKDLDGNVLIFGSGPKDNLPFEDGKIE